MRWTAPADLGGTSTYVYYDTLRSSNPADLVTTIVCLESDDGGDTQATTTRDPMPGEVYHFLVRDQNTCGGGSFGTTSSGGDRQGHDCP